MNSWVQESYQIYAHVAFHTITVVLMTCAARLASAKSPAIGMIKKREPKAEAIRTTSQARPELVTNENPQTRNTDGQIIC